MMGNDLNSEQIKNFLSYLGWKLYARANEYLEIWRAELETGEYEVLVPTDAAVDKDRLISLALTKLAEILARSEASLSEEIREHSDSAIAIRVIHADVQGGTIPLEDGILLNHNAKELLIAAANATLERRPLYHGRLPLPVSALIQNARLGQTAHGSYIIRVFCQEFVFDDMPASFVQATTKMLGSALKGLKESIESYQESRNPLIFESAIRNGVSANLCDAIAKISGKNHERAVQISLRTPPLGDLSPAEVYKFEFLPEHQEIIREASQYFRQTYTLFNIAIIGVIERLDRRVEQSGGTIRIAATLPNGVRRSVSLQLMPEQYQEAIRAHDTKMMVKVTGDVVVTPKTANLINWQDFTVVGNLDLFNT